MKEFRKSTRIAYWVLRALAISSALLLFSITGIVALQPASHATGIVITLPTDSTSSPAGSLTPTSTVDITPVATPTNTPMPTVPPTPTPQPPPSPPAPTRVPVPTKPPVIPPTPIPTISATMPPVQATATRVALGPVLPPAPPKGTPTVTPGPTPSGSPTINTGGTPMPATSNGNTGGSSTTQQNSDGGMMAMIKPMMLPIVGISTTALLGSAGLLALMFWRKRNTTRGTVRSFSQTSGSAQATEHAPSQNRPMLPFAMQSIAQYSPLLGAPNTSQLDAPAGPPASDFRPLTIDYPQIMEIHTDKTPVPVTPMSLQSLSPTPALQMAFANGPSSSAPLEASPMFTPARTPTQQNIPLAYQFPPKDPLLENLMQQAQMGIFALPDKAM